MDTEGTRVEQKSHFGHRRIQTGKRTKMFFCRPTLFAKQAESGRQKSPAALSRCSLDEEDGEDCVMQTRPILVGPEQP